MNKWVALIVMLLVALLTELLDHAGPFVRVESSAKRPASGLKKCNSVICALMSKAQVNVKNNQEMTLSSRSNSQDHDENDEGDDETYSTHFSLLASIQSVSFNPSLNLVRFVRHQDSPLNGATRHLHRPPIASILAKS